jgi:tetratricopeptide (TPR) repeat protein
MKIFKNPLKILALFFFVSIITAKAVFAYVPLAEAKYKQGLDYNTKGNYTMAIMSFEEAAQIDPSFNDALFNAGVLYEYTNQNTEAIATFEKLLKNNPIDGETTLKIASLYYKTGQYKKALSYAALVPVQSFKYRDSLDFSKKISQKIQQEEENQKILAQKLAAAKSNTPHIKEIIDEGFVSPTGVTKDAAGNLYVADYGNNSIVKITIDGKKSLIAKGKPLNGPVGIVVDKTNNVYVANYMANEVLKITPAGTISVIMKDIKKPYYLYLDATGVLYVSEQSSNTIINMKL